MARIKIDLPERFDFSTTIPVRITDINYGGHVGNDAVLSLIHEARMQFLKNVGYSELEFAGVGMIMSDVAIEFRNEIFYPDTITASVTAGEFTKAGFELFYKLEKETAGKKILVAIAKTGMVCYDYAKKKIVAVPEEVKNKLRK
ncbi:MAG TPA: thioesterase family protein [Chitinophagaceae bacterium]|nr:thioesterase family protein [Chitinophagaceae bacterium]